MSSQTQPQKVQVALSTIFSSGIDAPQNLLLAGKRDIQFPAYLSYDVRTNLRMSRNGRLQPFWRISVNRAGSTFAYKLAAASLRGNESAFAASFNSCGLETGT